MVLLDDVCSQGQLKRLKSGSDILVGFKGYPINWLRLFI